MRRTSTLLMTVGIVSLSYSTAWAQTAQVHGTVDWTALTSFQAQSAEVVFFDLFNDVRIVVPLNDLDGHAEFTATVNADTFYQFSAVVADCASDPEACGTSAAVGTHIRFGAQSTDGFPDGSVNEVEMTADAELNPTTLCGNVQVVGGTYVALSTVSSTGPDAVFSNGVFSSTQVQAPTASYCVLSAPFFFTSLDSTVTILQNTLPTCPAQLDVHRSDSVFMGPGPTTADILVTVPAPPGEITGSFSVADFPHDFTSMFAFAFGGSSFDPCAGLSFFSGGSLAGQALSFDIVPALPGPWQLVPIASRRVNTPDGLFSVIQEARAVQGSGFFQVVVPSGGTVAAPLAFNPAVVSGSMAVDVRRWGPITDPGGGYFPAFEGATRAQTVVGPGWTPSLTTEPPMQFSERYELDLDPRGTDWLVQAPTSLAIGFGYQFPSANGFASSSFGGLATMPNRNGNPPFLQGSNPAVLIGNVTAGARITVDLPPANFRVASVTLNPVSNGIAVFWNASNAQYPLANGVLSIAGGGLQSFSFDTTPAVGREKLPPGRYDGSTSSFDPDFNFFGEPRSLDLEPDDDLTADFGAPMLLGVRPIPGVSGGVRPVTGTVTSSDPAVTSLQVQVGDASAIVGADGAFSASATIGTGPLIIVASDNFGRTTTLKRYFTTMTGLLQPAAGADLVSEGLDINVIQNGLFFPPTPSKFFNAGSTIPLKLTGSLGGAPVTSANVTATAAPRIAALLFAGTVPVTPTGPTVFSFSGGLWQCDMSTEGLMPGIYVVQIQFWDGRILEAAFVLR